MSLESLIFFELGFLILIIPLGLIIITVYFSRLTKRFHLYQIEINGSKSPAAKDKTLDEARNKAMKIIDDANNKALDIVQKSNLFVSSISDNFDSQLKNVTSIQLKAFGKATTEFIQLYASVLNDLKSKNIEVFQTVSKNIENSTLEEVKKFKNIIEEETIASRKVLKEKIDREYLIAKKDVDLYKQNEIRMIEDNIYEILEKVASLVLGKAIKVSEHEELIIKALDKAKENGVFSNVK